MSEKVLLEIVAIIVLGVGAQWLAARVRLPSILLLLTFGFIAGPLTGVLKPDERFGDLLFPAASIAVALILYEGGLSLRLSGLRGGGRVVRNLCTFGALVTWIVGATAGHLLLDLEIGIALLLGAVLVVTGPTVVGPLLRSVRPTGPVGPILKWEGIVIDPIGAVLAVLVFEFIRSSGAGAGAAGVVGTLAKTVLFGGGLGLVGARMLTLLIHRYWVPDFLQSAVSLMLVVAVFAAANAIQSESGLLAVTVMGIALANQKRVDVEHIVEFKENLRVLLLSALFIVLAARLRFEDLTAVGWSGVLFVAVLIFVARPLSVWVSTIGMGLGRGERLFLAWVAPRGIVAAAVASIFAMHLEEHGGHAGTHLLVPIAFLTIIGTVAVYGLTAPLVARKVGVAVANPQGLLLVGAQRWVRALAVLLRKRGYTVLLVDSNREETAAARMEGLPTYTGSILGEGVLDELNLGGLGRLLAVTPNDWVNALAVRRFARVFGSAECYQLPPTGASQDKRGHHRHLQGRWLFGAEHTHADLSWRSGERATVKATPLTEEFDYAAFQARYRDSAVPLLIVTANGRLSVMTADDPPAPVAGQTVISLLLKRGPDQ